MTAVIASGHKQNNVFTIKEYEKRYDQRIDSNMNWSIKEDEILINFVREHEELYNVKSKNYRKFQLKLNLWRSIGAILNKSDTDCTKRWTYVRDYYIRRRGTRNGISGEAAKNRAALLSFLDSFTSSQKNATNVVEEENSEDEAETTDVDTQFAFVDSHNKPNEEALEDGSLTILVNNEDMEDDKDDVKRDRKRHRSEELLQFKQTPGGGTEDELDETDYFFMSIAKITKKLPRYEQAVLRMQISSLVGNAEIKYIRRESNELLSRASSTSHSDFLEMTTFSQPKKE